MASRPAQSSWPTNLRPQHNSRSTDSFLVYETVDKPAQVGQSFFFKLFLRVFKADSQLTVSKQSIETVSRHSTGSQQTFSRQSADSQQTVSRRSADSQQTASRQPADSQQTEIFFILACFYSLKVVEVLI